MKLFIEDYSYRADLVNPLLHELQPLESPAHTISLHYVGYFYSNVLHDCIFILPKVLVDEQGLLFGHLDPHQALDLNTATGLSHREKSFLYEFSVWVYRSIQVYNRQSPDNGIVYQRLLPEVESSRAAPVNGYLDILLALLHFGQRHRDFVLSTTRLAHAGRSRIHWPNTVTHTNPYFRGTTPYYLHPITKRAIPDLDDELLAIYYSILRYIADTYGFTVLYPLGLKRIAPNLFDRYLHGIGARRLRAIRYRYYTDLTLELWGLCYAFFSAVPTSNLSAGHGEYLLAKDYHIIFEAMIDTLLGDPNPPKGLKAQPDGKRVDHIYSHQGLLALDACDRVYYIGDSKYYRAGAAVGAEAVYKQFTYARNLIQWNIDSFFSAVALGDMPVVGLCRDELTEGYNIVPNFFISAWMPHSLSFADEAAFVAQTSSVFISKQFGNRLFDRDTLLVYHYKVNFLVVISLYAGGSLYHRAQWRARLRNLFTEGLRQALLQRYDFYVLIPRTSVDVKAFIQSHFQELLGKLYRPISFPTSDYLLLALERFADKAENDHILGLLAPSFSLLPCLLGQLPRKAMECVAGGGR